MPALPAQTSTGPARPGPCLGIGHCRSSPCPRRQRRSSGRPVFWPYRRRDLRRGIRFAHPSMRDTAASRTTDDVQRVPLTRHSPLRCSGRRSWATATGRDANDRSPQGAGDPPPRGGEPEDAAAVAAAGVPGARRQAGDRLRHRGRGGLEGGASVGRRRRGRSLLRGAERGAAGARCRAAPWPDLARRPRLASDRSRRRRGRHRRHHRRCRGGALRRRRPPCRHSRQRRRQAAAVRFHLRRGRQPLAARHRHLDRRRRAGVRSSRARQDRGPAAARLCPLGRGRPALAQPRPGDRSSGRSAPAVLAALHRDGLRDARPRSRDPRFRRAPGVDPRPAGGRRAGDPRRRRSRQSGAPHLARGAGAAWRRRDPVRRSRVAGHPRLSPAARRRRCWSARPATAPPASRRRSMP